MEQEIDCKLAEMVDLFCWQKAQLLTHEPYSKWYLYLPTLGRYLEEFKFFEEDETQGQGKIKFDTKIM